MVSELMCVISIDLRDCGDLLTAVTGFQVHFKYLWEVLMKLSFYIYSVPQVINFIALI